jgi:hypothetical protein
MSISNGRVIVGGISFGNVFTPVAVPIAYTLLARSRRRAVNVPAAAEPASLPQGAESARRARVALSPSLRRRAGFQAPLAVRHGGDRDRAPAHCVRAERRSTIRRVRNRSGAESFDRSIDRLEFVMRRREKSAGRISPRRTIPERAPYGVPRGNTEEWTSPAARPAPAASLWCVRCTRPFRVVPAFP